MSDNATDGTSPASTTVSEVVLDVNLQEVVRTHPAQERAVLRALTVGSKRSYAREMVEWQGSNFEVRQPSVKDRSAILAAGQVGAGAKGGQIQDSAALFVEAVVRCTFVPGTEVAVFELADRDALMAQPAGGFVDLLGATAMRLMNVEADRAGKGSVPTRSADSS